MAFASRSSFMDELASLREHVASGRSFIRKRQHEPFRHGIETRKDKWEALGKFMFSSSRGRRYPSCIGEFFSSS